MNANNTTSESTHVIGQQAEDKAARFLEKHGLLVLTRNFRCHGGEIDLICRDRNTLVFVEVRMRRNADFGGAGASITLSKQRRIILAAQHYLLANTNTNGDCRFDCVLLEGETIEWIRDAFSAD